MLVQGKLAMNVIAVKHFIVIIQKRKFAWLEKEEKGKEVREKTKEGKEEREREKKGKGKGEEKEKGESC
jgi:hypothetical protein